MVREELRKMNFFKDLDLAELDVISKKLNAKEIKAGTVIFKEDTPGDALYLILFGKVRIFKGLHGQALPMQDKRVTLATLEAGELFGEMSIFDKCLRSASAQAETDSYILSLKRSDFEELMNTHPKIALKLAIATMRVLSKRLRWMDARIL